MSNNLPLNGDRLLNHLEGSLRKSPAVSLAEALEGKEPGDDAPDGTNGAVRSYETSKAIDPSQGTQGEGNRRRLGKAQDPLLESLIATVNRRIR